MRRLRLRGVDISSMRWDRASSHSHVTCSPPFEQVFIHLFVTCCVLRCSRGHLGVHKILFLGGPLRTCLVLSRKQLLALGKVIIEVTFNTYCTLSNICLLPLHLSNPHWTYEETEALGSGDLPWGYPKPHRW